MDEDLIVLGAPAETQAAGGEDSRADGAADLEALASGQTATAAKPGEETAEPTAGNPQPEAPKGEGEGEGEPERPKKRTGITRMQERIARLEAENASLRSSAPTGAGAAERGAAIEKAIGPAPKESDFQDFLAYEDARAEYRLKKVLAEQKLAEQETSATTRQEQAREAQIEAFNDRLDEAREKISDFDKVMASAKGRETAPHVVELIVDSEKGALLAYYLAKTPEKLAELNRMSPTQAAKAVGALEHRLTLAKPKKAPAAPAPGKPVAGAATPKSADAEIDAWLAQTYGNRSSR